MDVAKGVLREFASTPGRLTKLSTGRDDAELLTRPSAGEWSATDIIAHLRANADVWGASIRRMLDEDHPTIRYVSPRSVMKKTEYADRQFTEGLELFVTARRQLLKTLRALRPEDWSRAATFTGRARGSEQTVLDYARAIAAHEAAHIPQFEALFAKPAPVERRNKSTTGIQRRRR